LHTSVINHEQNIQINLSDFATDTISSDYEAFTLNIPFAKLFDFLTRAEQIQEAREPDNGQKKVKNKRKTRKRRLSSSPIDELGDEDEASFRGLETKAVNLADAADKDFNPPGAKRRA
jgi:hypothetical protein